MWQDIKTWWWRLWLEEYILIISVPGDVVVHPDGTRTETKIDKTFDAKKLLKLSPKLFIFIDPQDRRNEIKFTHPVNYHVIKVY